MSYGYGGQQNPFDDREALSSSGYGGGGSRAPPQASFGQGPRPGGGASRYNGSGWDNNNNGGGNVEMAPLTQNVGYADTLANLGSDPNAILNECRSIDRGIEDIEQNLQQLRMLQDRSLNEADGSSTGSNQQLDGLASETMTLYRQLTERVRQVKSQKDAQQPKNAAQVGRIDRRLKNAIQQYQQLDAAFRKKTQEQMARQFRIVNPDATDEEVRAVVEDSNGGIFQQAMMQSDRRGQARAVLSAVQDRHDALRKIEEQLIELAQLFQDMDTLIVQQDAAVQDIEQKAEEVVVDLDKGNQHMDTAVHSAKAARKKKWICLGIVVAIILIIVIIVAIYFGLQHANNNGGKRSLDTRNVELLDGILPAAQVLANTDIPPRTMRLGKRIEQGNAADDVAKRFVIPGGVFNEHTPVVPPLPKLNTKSKRFELPGGVFHEPPRPLGERYVVNTDFTDNP